MRYNTLLVSTALATSGSAAAVKQSRQLPATTGGIGPYTSHYFSEPTLTGHTFYQPKAIPADLKIPVLVWSNGACSNDGTGFQAFLGQVSSYGVLAIASGAAGGTGSSSVQEMRDSINWVAANAGKGSYAHVDGTRIAAAGQSCGGLEALEMRNDTRVSTLSIFDSGEFGTTTVPSEIHVSIFYFMGGPTDIAYTNDENDYHALPATTPAWIGNLQTSHISTFTDANAGRVGIAGVRWLEWLLRGNVNSATFFTANGSSTDGWSVESKNLASIKVTPIS